mgnify:CR=1 FL=1|jgi:hypothetical protein
MQWTEWTIKMEATFWIFSFVAVLGYFLGQLFDRKKILHLKNNEVVNCRLYRRFWIPIKSEFSKTVKIKVKVYPNIGRKLAEDIETVTEGRILADSYNGYTYSEILAELTPEQIKDIKSLREFMKI